MRKKLKPLIDKVRQLEQRLDQVHNQAKTLDEQLADPELYNGQHTEQLTRLTRERADLKRHAEQIEEHWMQAQEQLEQAQAAINQDS